jgi:hypothetical protein
MLTVRALILYILNGLETVKFEISTYYYGSDFQKALRKNLKIILKEYSCTEILMPVFTCINELVVNAVKANYKKLYFEKIGVDPEQHTAQYEDVLKKFRVEFLSDGIKHLAKLARKKNLKTYLEGIVNSAGLTVRVINPQPITHVERENIIRKYSAARKSVEMMSYFESEVDDKCKEGAGLGIIFIGIILKSLGLTIETLHIDSIDDKTIATLTIPLNHDVVEHFKKNSRVD